MSAASPPPRAPYGTPISPLPEEAADRLQHLVAELHFELRRVGDEYMDVIEQAEMGRLLDGFKDEINRRRA